MGLLDLRIAMESLSTLRAALVDCMGLLDLRIAMESLSTLRAAHISLEGVTFSRHLCCFSTLLAAAAGLSLLLMGAKSAEPGRGNWDFLLGSTSSSVLLPLSSSSSLLACIILATPVAISFV